MKKIILLFVAVLGTVALASAQTEFSFGVKGGLDMANQTNGGQDARYKFSFYAGGFAEWRFGSLFALSPELYYSRQGFTFKTDYLGDELRVRQRNNYLNLPILAKFYVTDGLSLDVGPQVGYMLSSKIRGEADGESMTEDTMEDMNKVDCSIAMGFTANFAENFLFSLRFNLGVTDVLKKDVGNTQNRVLLVGLGYRF